MDNNRDKKPNGNNPNNRLRLILILAAVGLVTFLIINSLDRLIKSQTNKKVTYDVFLEQLEKKKIKEVEISSSVVRYSLKDSYGVTYYTPFLPDQKLYEDLRSHPEVVWTGKEESAGSGIIDFLLMYVLPILLMWGLLTILMRRMTGEGGVMGVGKSTAKMYMNKETGVTFRDVAGEDEAKESLTEIVDFLHNPQKYATIGAKLPKGALLVGPPGTGKTLLAKAVAGEAHVPFFSLSGSDFVEMFVGVGASRVRDLFKQAQQNAPCIIFIDEIDAIGKSRDSRYGGGNDEREQTLNQLLSEMDGFDASKGVLVMAATNRPEILDKALLRPGRFDRRIIVDRPDLKGRVEILKVHAKDVRMDQTVDLNAIALATSGAVGSDLANMINEAAINAVKGGRNLVSQKDLMEAVEVVLVGKEKKDRVMNQEERRIVSYHEVGHALISALQKDAEPVQKITIVPRTMGALGYVMQTPEEEKFLNSKNELLAMITVALGGRAAEEIVFNSITTGAANDIEKATYYARRMITMYGMSDEFGLYAMETVESQYLEGRTVLNCADATAARIDNAVIRLLADCYEKARKMLEENREVMDEIAKFLIEKETITGKEFMEIFNSYKKEEKRSTPENAETALTDNNIDARALGSVPQEEVQKPAPEEGVLVTASQEEGSLKEPQDEVTAAKPQNEDAVTDLWEEAAGAQKEASSAAQQEEVPETSLQAENDLP